jgi:hypothetical protein
MGPSERVTWLEHRGAKLLSVDLRSAQRGDQLLALAAYAAELEGAPLPGLDVLVLGDDSLDYHPDLATRAKSLMASQESKIRRSAFLGFSGIARVAFDGFFESARVLGRSLPDRGRHFALGEREAALDWLASGE